MVSRDCSNRARRNRLGHGEIVIVNVNVRGTRCEAGDNRDAGGDEVKSRPGVGVGSWRGR